MRKWVSFSDESTCLVSTASISASNAIVLVLTSNKLKQPGRPLMAFDCLAVWLSTKSATTVSCVSATQPDGAILFEGYHIVQSIALAPLGRQACQHNQQLLETVSRLSNNASRLLCCCW